MEPSIHEPARFGYRCGEEPVWSQAHPMIYKMSVIGSSPAGIYVVGLYSC
jgi:hypothetical protein